MKVSVPTVVLVGLLLAAAVWLTVLLSGDSRELVVVPDRVETATTAAVHSPPSPTTTQDVSAPQAPDQDSAPPSTNTALATIEEDPLLRAPVPPREALSRLMDCAFLADPEQPARLESRWAWLSPELAALERDWQAQAKRAVANHCADWAVDASTPRFRWLHQALRNRLSRSPDPLDRVLAALLAEQRAEEALPAIRAQIEDLVRRGRGQEMAAMADVLWMSPWWSPSTAGAYAGGNSMVLWHLVACDLGADCGARSHYLRRACAGSGYCGYPDVETLMHDAVLGQDAAERVAAARAALLERIRSGQVEGLFDPVPLPPTGP
jgi:hypothetical protein